VRRSAGFEWRRKVDRARAPGVSSRFRLASIVVAGLHTSTVRGARRSNRPTIRKRDCRRPIAIGFVAHARPGPIVDIVTGHPYISLNFASREGK